MCRSLGSNDDPNADPAEVMEMSAQMIRKILIEVPGMILAIENMVSESFTRQGRRLRRRSAQIHRCGGETSRSLDDLRKLIDRVNMPGRIRVCIDLCHLFVEQYDLFLPSGRDSFYAALDRLGHENIAAIHVSDSGEVHGGSKDRHAK